MIYFIQAASGGNIKIGYAKGIGKRLKDMQTGNGEELVLLLALDGDRGEERALHAKFASSHARGEWFAPTPELLGFINNPPESARGIEEVCAEEFRVILKSEAQRGESPRLVMASCKTDLFDKVSLPQDRDDLLYIWPVVRWYKGHCPLMYTITGFSVHDGGYWDQGVWRHWRERPSAWNPYFKILGPMGNRRVEIKR